ncbi:MAG: transcriptional regulator, AbrB family [Herbinix sp.]|jgi:transcriptional pleiotropic regulator of transition state genes|nr:transcriptional regulator, AbrB family [Herbinix sp.]
MKNTGMVRKLDDLGRVTLPMELRRTMDIAKRDALEIFTEGESIILRKYESKKCVFCGKTNDIEEFKNKFVCRECKEGLKK